MQQAPSRRQLSRRRPRVGAIVGNWRRLAGVVSATGADSRDGRYVRERDLRAPPLRPRTLQPLPRGDQRAEPAVARAPRPGVPPDHGRDLRAAAPGLGHHQRPHPAPQRDGLRRHGGGVRQHRPRGRRRRGRRSTGCSGSGCATSRPAAAPRSSPSSTSGARRSTSSGCSPPTRSPQIIAAVHAETSTGVRSDIAALGAGKGDALLVADAVTVHRRHRAARRRLGRRRRLRRHPEVPRRRARPRAVHDQRPRLRAPRREAALAGTSTSDCSAATSARRAAAAAGPTTTPPRSRWSSACTPASSGSWRRACPPSGRGTRRPAGVLQDGLEEMGMELFAAEGSRLPELTTVKVPDGVDSATVRRTAARAARHRDRRRRRASTPPPSGGSA